MNDSTYGWICICICYRRTQCSIWPVPRRPAEGRYWRMQIWSIWFRIYTSVPRNFWGMNELNCTFVIVLYGYVIVLGAFFFNTCTVHLSLFFIITNKCTVNIIKVYITAVYNLYLYIFQLFHVIIQEFTSAPCSGAQVFQIKYKQGVFDYILPIYLVIPSHCWCSYCAGLACNTHRCKLPDDDMKMSKHVGV